MKKCFALVFAFLLLGCQASETSPEASTEPEGPIQVGSILPLSGDGAVYGIMAQQAMQLRVGEINESGGINGRNLEVIYEDGKCNPGDSSKAAQKLINIDKISTILGGFCSGETLGAAPIAEKNQVLLFSGGSSSPEITHAGDFVFRTAPSDASQGKVLAEYANQQYGKIAVIAEQTDYALGIVETFESHYEGEVVREDYLSSESDFKTRITKLKAADPDAILISSQTPPKFEVILKQLQEQNWDKPVIMNEVGVSNPEFLARFADFFSDVTMMGANFVAPDNPELQGFLAKYEQTYGKKAEYENYVATILDNVDIFAKVVGEVGDETNTPELRDRLYNLEGYQGIFGPVRFDENGDVNITHSLFEWDGEKMVPLP